MGTKASSSTGAATSTPNGAPSDVTSGTPDSTVPDTILAIDGGGTHTRAVLLTRDAGVLAHASGPGCNPFDRPEWAQNLHDLLHRMRHPALQAATLGMAGYDAARPSSAEQEQVARAGLAAPVGGAIRLWLENDVETAHRAAFGGGAGVFVLAGTGSVAMARGAGGQIARVGGWGWLLGDEGGGYWIGRKALGHVTRFLDGAARREAAFATALLHRLGLPATGDNAADALREWVRTRAHPRSAMAALAHVVDDLAHAGDMQATALLQRAGTHLARQARLAASRVTPTTGHMPEHTPVVWSYGGSVMNSLTVRHTVAEHLGAAPLPPALPPLGGAALRSAELAGWAWDETCRARLGNALARIFPADGQTNA
ncbi:N-acetylglucosamine kinase [Acetobacter sp. TBRC 12305]|uniref:N-acetylglucosamine kinase n=2 Tax=Acetobacter garciniae TaxID=2817435 RepID=A0A939HHM9_9PROT|nr:N-acetylglucosamine kinase [Acetobacter garciniae]MBX0343256.1 N-acetylglucosamine kinase [Acetobacter garciniae]